MDVSQLVALIEKGLHPQPYTHRTTSLSAEVRLLLTVRRGLFGRYALAVCSWNPMLDGEAFLESRRKTVSRQLGALWMFREVGLYLVVCGARADWQAHVADMPADKTGLHAVIVQAVHFVDPDTGETELNQSAWGPVSFGGVDSIAPIIDSIAKTPMPGAG